MHAPKLCMRNATTSRLFVFEGNVVEVRKRIKRSLRFHEEKNVTEKPEKKGCLQLLRLRACVGCAQCVATARRRPRSFQASKRPAQKRSNQKKTRFRAPVCVRRLLLLQIFSVSEAAPGSNATGSLAMTAKKRAQGNCGENPRTAFWNRSCVSRQTRPYLLSSFHIGRARSERC